MPDFHVLVVWNERAHCWVEIMSSFDRWKPDSMVPYLASADVVAQVVTCGDDSDAAIAFVVDTLRAPRGSFADSMREIEDGMVVGFAPPRKRKA